MEKILIQDIDNIQDDHVYVLIAGGIACGKSHVVKTHIHKILIIDVDNFMSELGFSDYNPEGHEYRTAMAETAKMIKETKAQGRSLVAMGTASNYDFAKFRLEEARQDGYKTVLLHITVDSVDTAHNLNALRRGKGLRAVQEKDYPVIQKTSEGSRETVKRLLRENPDLIDFYCEFQNRVDAREFQA